MSRPALVIGLGGTGQWVLTYLKRELIEAYMPDRGGPGVRENGLPIGVRFLAFDSVKERIVTQGNQQELGGDVRQRKVGSIELEEDFEYVFFGGNIRDAVDIIWNDQDENFQTYKPQTWLKESYPTFPSLADTVMNVVDGAGAIRQVGRLGMIKDINKVNSKVHGAISRAIQEIVDELGQGAIAAAQGQNNNAGNRLEVIFVNSLAGGTGAGIFIDIALWCRHILDVRFPGATIFRAFLVSPFAFTSPGPNADTEKMARSFAAWRELSRFLTVGAQNVCGPVIYDGTDINKRVDLDQRLFDVTYMIDPNRPDNPLVSGHPEKNLYPSVAQAIAAILDPEAGAQYSQDAINYAADLGNKDAHCAFGCYAIKVPIYYHWQKFATQLEIATLTELLAPTLDGNGQAIGISVSANREHPPADVGRDAVITALRKANLPYGNRVYQIPYFWQNIGNAIKGSWHENEGVIRSTAANFPSDGNWGSYGQGGILDKLSEHPNGQAILGEMARNFEDKQVYEWVPLTEKPLDDLEQNPGLIKQKLIDHYSATDGNPGSFKKTMASAGNVQFELFANYLRALLEQELNGSDADPHVARGGKLGWVKAFLKELQNGLVDYQSFCKKVLDTAAGNGITGMTTQTAADRFNDFEADAGKQAWLTFFDNNTHPKAHHVERQYYYAQQSLACLQKETLLFIQHRDTANKTAKFVEKSLADLENWEKVFVKGGSYLAENNPRTTSGVFAEVVKESQENDQEYQDTDSQQSQLQYVGRVDYPDRTQEVTANLAALSWTVSIAPGYSSLLFDLSMAAVPLTNGRSDQKGIGDGVEKSHKVLHKQCEQPFTRLVTANAPNSVFNELKRKYAQGGGAGLANEIEPKARPFWRLTPGGKGAYAPIYGNPFTGLVALRTAAAGNIAAAPAQPDANRVPAQAGPNPDPPAPNQPAPADPFIMALLTRLGLNQSVRYDIAPRHDPYTFTLFRSDNVIPSKDFNVFKECKQTYLNQYLHGNANGEKTNLEKYHIFPAEVHAAQYEREIAEILWQNFNLLSPEVVGLLDDKEKVDNFFKAAALGYLRRQFVTDAGGMEGYAWVYQIGNGPLIWLSELQLTPIPDETTTPYLHFINHVMYKSSDIRQNVNQVNMINWTQLRTDVWNKELSHTAQAPYKAQYDLPANASARQALLDAATESVSNKQVVPWPILADLALKGQVDLAHLCELVLRKANKEPVPQTEENRAVI